MYISRRVKQITMLFLESREALSVKDVAIRLELSERTVYRELEEVRLLLESNHLDLITIPNRGMLLQGRADYISKLLNELIQESHVEDYRVEERVELETLKILVEQSFIKWEAVSSYIGVSLSTTKKDQTLIKEYLKKRNLFLDSKMGEGVRVEGTVHHKHIAIMDILIKNIEIANMYNWLRNNGFQQSIFLRIVEERYNGYFQQAYQIVENMSSIEEKSISDVELIEFIILLACWLQGVSSKLSLDFNEKLSPTLKWEQELSSFILTESSLNPNKKWEQYLDWLIQAYFGSKERLNSINLQSFTNQLKIFIQNIENALGINLMENVKLFSGLEKHLSKAINRVNSGISIRNPLDREIKKNYQNLYSIVTDSANQVFGVNFFPDDEIGYLVLYVAVALDKLVDKSFRVLIVCSSGMGSSKMLANRLEREIPEVYVKKMTSLMELHEIELDEFELVLSTVPLYLNKNEYMRVSPLLNENELETIRQKIENHKYSSLMTLQNKSKLTTKIQSNKSAEILYEFYASSKLSVDLVKNLDFEVLDINSGQDLSSVISEFLIGKGILDNLSMKTMIKDWAQNYFSIPNRGYAILNCPTTTTQSKLFVFDVKLSDEKVNKIIVLSRPINFGQKLTALLSNLIISLVTNEETESILASNDLELMKQFFAEELRSILIEIL